MKLISTSFPRAGGLFFFVLFWGFFAGSRKIKEKDFISAVIYKTSGLQIIPSLQFAGAIHKKSATVKETKTDPTCTPTFTKLRNRPEKFTIESDERK